MDVIENTEDDIGILVMAFTTDEYENVSHCIIHLNKIFARKRLNEIHDLVIKNKDIISNASMFVTNGIWCEFFEDKDSMEPIITDLEKVIVDETDFYFECYLKNTDVKFESQQISFKNLDFLLELPINQLLKNII